MERAIVDYNGRPGDPASFDRLEAFVTDQPYRLCHWRVATDEINYRRFFDVDSLAAIRVEDPEVFQAVHEPTLALDRARLGHGPADRSCRRLARSGPSIWPNLADGVRRAKAAARRASRPTRDQGRLYTIVEKILGSDESLPADWPVQGTTGYDFLNLLNGVFVDRLGGYALRDVYVRFIGNSTPFADVLHDSKRTILATSLSAELYVLSNALGPHFRAASLVARFYAAVAVSRAARSGGLFSGLSHLHPAGGGQGARGGPSGGSIDAVRVGQAAQSGDEPLVLRFHPLGAAAGASARAFATRASPSAQQFVYKFQQFTGPVIAKGLEDTAFYRYFPLASLNEVGSDPMRRRHFGRAIPSPHRRSSRTDWPHSAAGHRHARHQAGRRPAGAAQRAVRNSRRVGRGDPPLAGNERRRAGRRLDGAPVPDANEEYLIYQILVGTWPVGAAGRTGPSTNTSSGSSATSTRPCANRSCTPVGSIPNEEYDQAVASFIRTILADFDSPFIRRSGRVRRLDCRCRLRQFAGADADQDVRAGRARLLSRGRVLGFQSGRSRQPPAGRFRGSRPAHCD